MVTFGGKTGTVRALTSAFPDPCYAPPSSAYGAVALAAVPGQGDPREPDGRGPVDDGPARKEAIQLGCTSGLVEVATP